MAGCTHSQRRPRDSYRDAEAVDRGGVQALQLGGLLPAACLREHIRPAGTLGVEECAHDGSRARNRHRPAEVITGDGVGTLELGSLLPAGPSLGEHVGPASSVGAVGCTHHHGRTRDRHRGAELVPG